MFYQFLTFFATPVLAQNDYGLSVTAGAAELEQFGDNLPNLIGSVLGTALSLVGVLFFALMLYGGITWMMAHGNAEQEKKALSTITAAIIGILIVLGSYAITKFVFSAIQGAGGANPPPPPAQQSCKPIQDKEALTKLCALKCLTPLICSDAEKTACGNEPLCVISTIALGTSCVPKIDPVQACASGKDSSGCAKINNCKWE